MSTGNEFYPGEIFVDQTRYERVVKRIVDGFHFLHLGPGYNVPVDSPLREIYSEALLDSLTSQDVADAHDCYAR